MSTDKRNIHKNLMLVNDLKREQQTFLAGMIELSLNVLIKFCILVFFLPVWQQRGTIFFSLSSFHLNLSPFYKKVNGRSSICENKRTSIEHMGVDKPYHGNLWSQGI